VISGFRDDKFENVFLDAALCSLVEIERRFGRAYFREDGKVLKKSVNFYQITWFNIPEDSDLRFL
jgi:hypothetical protein